MITVKTLHSHRADKRRLQLAVYTSAFQNYGGKPILLGWIDLGVFKNQPPFAITLSDVWFKGISSQRQPCKDFSDGLRRFVAIERLISNYGLDKATELLKACQALSEKA